MPPILLVLEPPSSIHALSGIPVVKVERRFAMMAMMGFVAVRVRRAFSVS
jgi:hypothetical protein